MSLPKPRVSLRTHIRKFHDYLHGKHIGFTMAFCALVLVGALGTIVAAANGLQQVFPQAKAEGCTEAGALVCSTAGYPGCDPIDGCLGTRIPVCVNFSPICITTCGNGSTISGTKTCNLITGVESACTYNTTCTTPPPPNCVNFAPSCTPITCSDGSSISRTQTCDSTTGAISACTASTSCPTTTTPPACTCANTQGVGPFDCDGIQPTPNCCAGSSFDPNTQYCDGGVKKSKPACTCDIRDNCLPPLPTNCATPCTGNNCCNNQPCDLTNNSCTNNTCTPKPECTCSNTTGIGPFACVGGRPSNCCGSNSCDLSLNSCINSVCNSCTYGKSGSNCNAAPSCGSAAEPKADGTQDCKCKSNTTGSYPNCMDPVCTCQNTQGMGPYQCTGTIPTNCCAGVPINPDTQYCLNNVITQKLQCTCSITVNCILPGPANCGCADPANCCNNAYCDISANTCSLTTGCTPKPQCNCANTQGIGPFNNCTGTVPQYCCGGENYDPATKQCVSGTIQNKPVCDCNIKTNCIGEVPLSCPDERPRCYVGVNQCQNGGTIRTRNDSTDNACYGGFKEEKYCVCQNGFTGVNCEIPPIIFLPSCTENQSTTTCTCDGASRNVVGGRCVTIFVDPNSCSGGVQDNCCNSFKFNPRIQYCDGGTIRSLPPVCGGDINGICTIGTCTKNPTDQKYFCAIKPACTDQVNNLCNNCGGINDTTKCESKINGPYTSLDCTGDYLVQTYSCKAALLPTCTSLFPNSTSGNCNDCSNNTALCKTRIESITDEFRCTGNYNETVSYCDTKPVCVSPTVVGDCSSCGGLSNTTQCTTKTTLDATNGNCAGNYTLVERICKSELPVACSNKTIGDCSACGNVGSATCITTVNQNQTSPICTGTFTKTTNVCQAAIPNCSPEGVSPTSTCNGHGTVVRTNGSIDATCTPGYHSLYTCLCNTGWSGSQCSLQNCPNGDADNNGMCGDQRAPCVDGIMQCKNGSTEKFGNQQQNALCFGGSTKTRSCTCVGGYGGEDCSISPAQLCPDNGVTGSCGAHGTKRTDNAIDLTCSGGFRPNSVCDCKDGYTGVNCQIAPTLLPSCIENQPISTCTCDGNRSNVNGNCKTNYVNTCTAKDQACTTSSGIEGRCLTSTGGCFYDPVASCRTIFPDCATEYLSKDVNGVCSCTKFVLGNNCSPTCTGDKKCSNTGTAANTNYQCRCDPTTEKTAAQCAAEGKVPSDQNNGGCNEECKPKANCTSGQDASLCNCDLNLNAIKQGICVKHTAIDIVDKNLCGSGCNTCKLSSIAGSGITVVSYICTDKSTGFKPYCNLYDNIAAKNCVCTGIGRVASNGICDRVNICDDNERIAFQNCVCDQGRNSASGNCKPAPAPGYDQVNGIICLRPGVKTKNDGVGCCPGSQFNAENVCTTYASLPLCTNQKITSPCTCKPGTTYDGDSNTCKQLTGGANGICRDGDVWKRGEQITCQCSAPLRATPDGKCIKPTLTSGQNCAGQANKCIDGLQCYDLSVNGTNFIGIKPTCFGTIDFCTPIVINSITGEKLCFRLSDHPIEDGIKQVGAVTNVVNFLQGTLQGGTNALINLSGNISAPNVQEIISICSADAAKEILTTGKKWEDLGIETRKCIENKGKEWFDKNIANANLVTTVISSCAGSQNALKPGSVWSELPPLVQNCIAGLVGNAEKWVTDNFTAPVRNNNGTVIVPGKSPKCDKEGNNGTVKTCICNADRAQSYCNFDPAKNSNCKPVDVLVDKKIVNKVYSCDYSKVTSVQTNKPLFTFATKTPSKNKIVLTATQAAIDSCTTLIQNNYLPSTVLPKDTGYLYPYGMQSFKIPCATDTVLQITTELKPGDTTKNWYVRKLGRIQPQNPDLIAFFTFDAARIFQYTENGKTYLVANIPLQNDIFGDDGYGDNQISGVFGFATDDTALTGSINKTTLQYINELRAQQAIDQGVINNANSSSGTNSSLQPNNPSSSKSVLALIKTGGVAASVFFIIGSFALMGLVWYTLTLRKRQLKNIRNI